jgi:hypothetical protein
MSDVLDGGANPASRRRSVNLLDYTALVLVGSATGLVIAGLAYAFAYNSVRGVNGTERFRLLAQAATPFAALLLVLGIALVVYERRSESPTPQVGQAVALGLGGGLALFVVLLALNGIVIDLSRASQGLVRLSNVVGRLVTVALAGYALALAATAPGRRDSPPVLEPTPSLPGAPDSGSPT